MNIRAQFFAVRVIDVCNRLPADTVTADTVASFVKGINSLRAHFLVSDFDYITHIVHSLLWAAISACYSLAVPPS